MGRFWCFALAFVVLATAGGIAFADSGGPAAHAHAGGVIIPEPATLGLMAVGFAAIFYRRRPRSFA
jgi:hypothetical protein